MTKSYLYGYGYGYGIGKDYIYITVSGYRICFSKGFITGKWRLRLSSNWFRTNKINILSLDVEPEELIESLIKDYERTKPDDRANITK